MAQSTPTPAEQLADEILKASGSALKHYTMALTRERIIAAAQRGLDEAHKMGWESAHDKHR